MARGEKVVCSCGCATMVSADTERRHRKKRASATLQASVAAKGLGPLAPLLSKELRAGIDLSTRPRINFLPIPSEDAASGESEDLNMAEDVHLNEDIEMVDNHAGVEGMFVTADQA